MARSRRHGDAVNPHGFTLEFFSYKGDRIGAARTGRPADLVVRGYGAMQRDPGVEAFHVYAHGRPGMWIGRRHDLQRPRAQLARDLRLWLRHYGVRWREVEHMERPAAMPWERHLPREESQQMALQRYEAHRERQHRELESRIGRRARHAASADRRRSALARERPWRAIGVVRAWDKYRFAIIRALRKRYRMSVEDAAHIVDSHHDYLRDAERWRILPAKAAETIAWMTVKEMGGPPGYSPTRGWQSAARARTRRRSH